MVCINILCQFFIYQYFSYVIVVYRCQHPASSAESPKRSFACPSRASLQKASTLKIFGHIKHHFLKRQVFRCAKNQPHLAQSFQPKSGEKVRSGAGPNLGWLCISGSLASVGALVSGSARPLRPKYPESPDRSSAEEKHVCFNRKKIHNNDQTV